MMPHDREGMDNDLMDMVWHIQERIYHDVMAAREGVRLAATEYAIKERLPTVEAIAAVRDMVNLLDWGIQQRLQQLAKT